MKLHCPHCGVKGSAEDSYIGRKVKCPKCQGVFEVLGDMASEPPADAPFPATLSPLPAEIPFSEPAVEISGAVGDDLFETETETKTDTPAEMVADTVLVEEEADALYEGHEEITADVTEQVTEPEPALPPAAEQEETLDWEDIASEIDLQLAEATMGEEQQESLQDGPVGLSSFEEDFAKPVDDFDRMEEFPPLDVDDGQRPADPSYEQDHEQVPGELLNAERPSGGDKELPDDSISGYDNEKSSGKTTFQVWAKVRAALAKWFGK